MKNAAIVVTTIQSETDSLGAFRVAASAHELELIIVADRKTPADTWQEYRHFLAFDSQRNLGFRLESRLPVNHYARKNLGYLFAIRGGFKCIYDTDDDNAPLENWAPRIADVRAQRVALPPWVNVYSLFGAHDTWPRGLPLEHVKGSGAGVILGNEVLMSAPIQQGLANGSPDVDAVWRLTADRDVSFQSRPSIALPPGNWCPFNSQSTWWFEEAFPLLYLPSHVSFRMTDIWRSFVAQRCLWEMDRELVFVGPEVIQDRNPHNLLRDFEQEIPGYLNNERIRVCLESLSLECGPTATCDNLRACYVALVNAGFVPEKEMDLVDAWLSDLQFIKTSQDI